MRLNIIYNGLGLDILVDYQYEIKQNGRYKQAGELEQVNEYYYGNGLLLAAKKFGEPGRGRWDWGRDPLKDVSFYHQDVLGSVVMLTDRNGQVEERYQYDVWGKAYDGKFADGFPGCGQSDNVYGFTGQRYQTEIGVYSFPYRDYSPRAMRWLTEDPIRDEWNWYRYCGGDPVNFTDSYGLNTWLIHGTWSDPSTFSQEFEDAVGEAFNDTTSRYKWSGENTESARWTAAQGLVNETLAYTLTNPDGPVNYVGHSHGGNVAIKAANTLSDYGVQVNNLVTMGTPVRGDYQLTGDNVNNHTNIYNPYDFTQVLGGDLFSLPGIGEFGPAGRTFDNANNIAYAYYGNIFNPLAPFTENHSVYYNNPDCYNTWLSQITENNSVNNNATDDYSNEDESKN